MKESERFNGVLSRVYCVFILYLSSIRQFDSENRDFAFRATLLAFCVGRHTETRVLALFFALTNQQQQQQKEAAKWGRYSYL